MAEKPISARETMMMADLDRDHLTPHIRRCIDEAMVELGRDDISGKEYALAELAAKKAMKGLAESMVGMSSLANRVAELRDQFKTP